MFEKYTNIKFQCNPSSRSRVISCAQTDKQTDTMKLTVIFRNFANMLKNVTELQTWFHKNNLMINTDKTTEMCRHIRQNRNPSKPQVTFHKMDTAKLQRLGTYITGNLKENVQVRSLSPKLS